MIIQIFLLVKTQYPNFILSCRHRNEKNSKMAKILINFVSRALLFIEIVVYSKS